MSLRMLVYLFTVELIAASAAIRRVPGSPVAPLHQRTWRHRAAARLSGGDAARLANYTERG